MENLLVTGASGLLGGAVCAAARGRFNVHGTYLTHPVGLDGVRMTEMDLTSESEAAAIDDLKPAYIIHCAAMTDLELCQEQPKRAALVNVTAAEIVARAAKRCGAYFVHLSTEGVFDGKMGEYVETDTARPLNVYGQTKLDSELAVLRIAVDGMVVRTTIYGWNVVSKPNPCEWVLSRLRAKESVTAFEDAFFSPILANDLAEILLGLRQRRLTGVYHLAGGRSCSRYDFFRALAETYGLDASLIRPVSFDKAVFKAAKPANVTMDSTRAEKLLGVTLPGFREGLARFKALEEGGYRQQFRKA